MPFFPISEEIIYPHQNFYDVAESLHHSPPHTCHHHVQAVQGGALPPPSSPNFVSYFVCSMMVTCVLVTRSSPPATQTPRCFGGGPGSTGGTRRWGQEERAISESTEGCSVVTAQPWCSLPLCHSPTAPPPPRGPQGRAVGAWPGQRRAEPTATYSTPSPTLSLSPFLAHRTCLLCVNQVAMCPGKQAPPSSLGVNRNGSVIEIWGGFAGERTRGRQRLGEVC